MQANYKNVYYPPGGILLWFIIFLELITFAAALIMMVFDAKLEPALYHESRLQLNAAYGAINTVFLLTSGFFMANTVHAFKDENTSKARKYLIATILFGVFFLILKAIEYSGKIDAGLILGSNSFFTYYWMLTLFHVLHVIVGLIILVSIYFGIEKVKTENKMADIEASAAFWHMCDLIWLLLFPVIYLIF